MYDEDGSPAFALRRIGKLHETGQGEQVDIGPEREACYWNCRYGCAKADVFVIDKVEG